MDNSEARPALYYPYIHIRSEHWLKATLLCVPSVTRMVPEGYVPDDEERIALYKQLDGPGGPLLRSVPASSAAAHQVQHKLLENIRSHRAEIDKRFSRDKTSDDDQYWIQDGKFNHDLLKYLLKNNLAWPSRINPCLGERSWIELHPKLGSAIMTTLGLSIAREQNYDIVTPSSSFHERLLTTNTDSIFEVLLYGEPESPVSREQAERDLGQLVITLSGVNFEALAAEDIPELKASKHFLAFRELLCQNVRHIDRRDGEEAYRQGLRNAAEEIVDAWARTKSDVSRSIKSALFAESPVISAEALRWLLERSAEPYTLGALTLGVVMAGGTSLYSRWRNGPCQYLTEVVGKQKEELRLMFPLGIER